MGSSPWSSRWRKKRRRIIKAVDKPAFTKTRLAKDLGISRSSLYYQPIKPQQDWHLKNQIELVLHAHPSYGHKRLALTLNLNKKKVLRVMHLFGIKPYRRRGRRYHRVKANGSVYPNLIHELPFPDKPNQIWASDFTHISFHGKFLYLATIKDVYDRRIVGWSLLTSHSVQLVILALLHAVSRYGRPDILHSDQGSEYKSRPYTKLAEGLGIKLSMSHKGSPWENGYQESFYSHFKVDLGDPSRFATLGELAFEIYYQMQYYNYRRIHSKLKMAPITYAKQHNNLITKCVPHT